MSKTMKKLMTLLVAVVMMLSMCTVAMAAKEATGSITISNLTTSVETTVKIYKVASLDVNGNNWVIEKWAQGIVNGIVNGKYVDEDGNALENLKDLKDLKDAAKDATATASATDQANPGTVKFEKITIGSYLVLADDAKTEYNPMIADVFAYGKDNLATAKDVKIVAKGQDYKTDKTNNDGDQVVGVGQIVKYTISASVPFFEKDEQDKTYVITDTLTGADYVFSGDDGEFTVKVGAEELDIQPVLAPDNQSFTLDLSSYINDNNSNAGKSVTIVYNARVNAVDEVNNIAKSTHNASDKVGSTKSFTGQAQITKTDDTDQKKPLEGAQFALCRLAEDGETYEYAVLRNEYITGEWVAEKPANNNNTVTTNESGIAVVKGLDKGTYYFEEIVAPEGYSLNTEKKKVEVSLEKKVAEERKDLTMGVNTMSDTKLSALPTTGGIGTYIFTIFGVVLMASAAGVFFVRRRRDA